MIPLIGKIDRDFDELGVNPMAKDKFLPLLESLGNKNEATLEHSVRVAYLGRDIARFTNIVEEKTLWLPGLVHDVGKLLIRPETLTKTIGYNADDTKEMSNHVEYGFKMLSGIADFSALALLYHHFFKDEGAYPLLEDINRILGNRYDSWSEATRTLAKYCGRLIAIADFYDAVTTRENDKHSPGKPRLPTREESRELLTEKNRDQSHLIEKLYEAEIFR